MICKNDFDENHAEEERVCSEFQDVLLNYTIEHNRAFVLLLQASLLH